MDEEIRDRFVVRSTGNVANGCTCVEPQINVPITLYKPDETVFVTLVPTKITNRTDPFFGPYTRVQTGQLTFDIVVFVPGSLEAESLLSSVK